MTSPIRSRAHHCRSLVACAGVIIAAVAHRPATADAQAPSVRSDTITLSLHAAVRRGMQRNEDIGVARSQLRGAAADRSSARSAFMPQLKSQSSYQRTLRSPFDDLSGIGGTAGAESGIGGIVDGFLDRKNSYTTSLQASQLLFSREAVAGIQVAREAEQVQRLQLTERELDVTLQVVQVYYGAVLAERVAEITAAALEEANKQLHHVRLTRAAGNASDLDVLNVEVQRDNLEPQRIQALNARDQALLNLKRLIDHDSEAPLRLSDSLEPEAFSPLPASALDSIASSYRQRAQIAAADRQVTIQRLRESGARGSNLPSLALGASFGKQGAWAAGMPNGDDLKDSWTVSLALEAPIFDGGQRRAEVAAAHERGVQSRLQLEQLKKGVALDVALQRGELDRAAAAIQARSHTALQARKNYDLMELAYSKGVVNTLQLSDARLQLRQARVNEVQALHDYYLALARLRRAAGHSPLAIAE